MTEYGKALMTNATIRKLRQKAENETITSTELNRLVGEYGKVAGSCVAKALRAEYPNGQIEEEDVRRIISPIRKQCHALVNEVTAMVLNAQYKKSGVGIKAANPEYSIQRENEMVKELSRRSFEDGFFGKLS